MSGIDILLAIVALLMSITFHEFCHAWMADRLGDPTGRLQGRLTLNPIAHIDLFGTVIFPLLLISLNQLPFGWAKPVQYNPYNLSNARRDGALIALAGPLANILIAILVAIPFKYLANTVFAATPGYQLLYIMFVVNVSLFAFNMLPFPPLDGSKVLGLIVPDRFAYQYGVYLAKGARYFSIIILLDFIVLRNLFGFSVIMKLTSAIAEHIRIFISLGT
jgi:Zn-dependent protease